MTDALPNPQDQERLKEIAAAETANNRASAEDLAKAINGMKALAVEEGTRNFLLVDGISAAFAMTSRRDASRTNEPTGLASPSG